MMTVSLLEGVNLRDGATEQDATVLSLGVGTDMRSITDVIVPNVPNLFTFSTLATFHEQLLEYGVDISKGQLNRLLIEGHERFRQEKEAILMMGFQVSKYLQVDDTGAPSSREEWLLPADWQCLVYVVLRVPIRV